MDAARTEEDPLGTCMWTNWLERVAEINAEARLVTDQHDRIWLFSLPPTIPTLYTTSRPVLELKHSTRKPGSETKFDSLHHDSSSGPSRILFWL